MSRLVETGRTARRGRLARVTLGPAALTGAVLLSALAPAAQAGLTARVSVASAGAQAHEASTQPAISADGRYVVSRRARRTSSRVTRTECLDVFVHDRQSGTTERVSVSRGGAQANGGFSRRPAISADGRYVAFVVGSVEPRRRATRTAFRTSSCATARAATTERVSVGSAAARRGTATASSPAISADGRYVAFRRAPRTSSRATRTASTDVFVRDRQSGTTERVSVGTGGAQGNDDSRDPAISADGRYVGVRERRREPRRRATRTASR